MNINGQHYQYVANPLTVKKSINKYVTFTQLYKATGPLIKQSLYVINVVPKHVKTLLAGLPTAA
jgi:hypothetical protein